MKRLEKREKIRPVKLLAKILKRKKKLTKNNCSDLRIAALLASTIEKIHITINGDFASSAVLGTRDDEMTMNTNETGEVTKENDINSAALDHFFKRMRTKR